MNSQRFQTTISSAAKAQLLRAYFHQQSLECTSSVQSSQLQQAIQAKQLETAMSVKKQAAHVAAVQREPQKPQSSATHQATRFAPTDISRSKRRDQRSRDRYNNGLSGSDQGGEDAALTRRRHLVQETSAVIAKLQSLIHDGAPSHGDDESSSLPSSAHRHDHERRFHALRLQIQSLLMRMGPSHFAHASTRQLLELLRTVSLAGLERECRYLTGSCVSMLASRCNSLSVRELIEVLRLLQEVSSVHRLPSVGLAESSGSATTVDASQQLMERLLAAVTTHGDASPWASVPPRSVCRLLRSSLPAKRTTASEFQEASQQATAAMQPRMRELLMSYLEYLMTPAEVKKGTVGTLSSPPGSPLTIIADTRLRMDEIAVLCRLCALHRVPSERALAFLAHVAPRVKEHVIFLRPSELSDVIFSYASIGYRNMEWFFAVGQRAGDIGEQFREDEVARILQAFQLLGVEHQTLRNSLESSLRMRQLRRRCLHDKLW